MLGHNWEPATGILMEVTPDSGGEPFRCECEEPLLMLQEAAGRSTYEAELHGESAGHSSRRTAP
jgi:hypothetical protein